MLRWLRRLSHSVEISLHGQPWNRLQALQHVTTAQEALSTGDMEVAQSSMEQALAIAPRDPNVLTAFGSMLADVGNFEKAILTLRQAVRIEPDTGFEKYMCERRSWLYVVFTNALPRAQDVINAYRYLGQLLGSSTEADEAFSSGIEILKKLGRSLVC